MKQTLVILFTLLTNLTFAQCYKKVNSEYQAKYKIFITTDESQANVFGYEVVSYAECLSPGLIYFAPIYLSFATPVYEVKNVKDADLIIYWVDSKEKAKWKK